MSEEKSTNNRPCCKRRSGWTEGAVLIVLGIIFLYHNLGGYPLRNWWAFLILIPAVSALSRVWRICRDNGGRFSNAARGPLIQGLALVAVALVFIMDWDWSRVWPVFLIIGGIGALISAKSDKDSKEETD